MKLELDMVLTTARTILENEGDVQPHVLALVNNQGYYFGLDFTKESEKERVCFMAGATLAKIGAVEAFFVSDAYVKTIKKDGQEPYPGVAPADVPMDDRQECLSILKMNFDSGSGLATSIIAPYIRRGAERKIIEFKTCQQNTGESGGRMYEAFKAGWKFGRTMEEK